MIVHQNNPRVSPSTCATNYEKQLGDKIRYLHELLMGFGWHDPEIYPSPPTGFRFRAEFRLLKDASGKLVYAMHEPGQRNKLVAIQEFPIAAITIQQLMPLLLPRLQQIPPLVSKLFYIEFLASTTGEIIICLIYHRPLESTWQSLIETEQAALQSQTGLTIHFIGRSKGQKICVPRDFLHEEFCIDGCTYRYQQVEGSFTQPNAYINKSMLGWVTQSLKHTGGDLLELYCGNGNFTIPLSKIFNRILATEVSSSSIKSANYNLQANHVSNVSVVRLSSEETAQALEKTRPFRRLSHLTLDDFQFTTVLVDPPRAGIDDASVKFISQFDKICYISCNPVTLAANLQQLTQTHSIVKTAVFDQFPFTHHIETGTILQRKKT